MKTAVRLSVLAMLAAVAVILAAVTDLPDRAQIQELARAGPVGLAAFVLTYATLTLLPLPKNALSAAAGFVFGIGLGVALVWMAAVVGAVVAFWMGRWLGRDVVVRLIGRRLDRLDALVLRHGAVTVLVARLIPVVPFTAVNYGSGVTAIGFRSYLAGTAIGIVPGTVAYVAVGAYGTQPTSWPFLTAAAALAALTLGGAWFVRRRSAIPEAS
jgi:MYXO-CTERM domain-containing protein